ncbi:hypothetical protein [Prescottella sp. R16]|uniref:Uncharacterized protein n=1 Tax=Nocardia thailandica TaxID=257275 RepID=A0ABW6PH79_9NOCA|nr:hypothetical protein [Prescottella sp. R16]
MTKYRSAQPCEREGCPGLRFGDHPYCCYSCKVIAQELENTERVCKAIGDSELATELWTEVVELSDTLSRYLELNFRLRLLALESGITHRQWNSFHKGRAG